MNRKHWFILLLFIALTSCNQTKKSTVIKSVELDEYAGISLIPNNICSDNNVLVAWLGSTMVHIIEFDSSGTVDKQNITLPFDCQAASISSFMPTDTTIIHYPFIEMSESSRLMVYNINNSTVRNIYMKQCLPEFPLHGIKYCEHQVFLNNFSDILDVTKSAERIEYYKTVRPISQIDLQTNTTSVWGEFPDLYKCTNHNFYDWHPVVCPLSKNNCLVSYACDDSIYLYVKKTKVEAFHSKSKYVNKFTPFDDDKSFDMAYVKKYLTSEPRYTNLIYNPFSKETYRVVSHGKPIDKHGKVINENATWSIIVMDSNFNTRTEYLFNEDEYNQKIIIPAREGVYIGKTVINPNDKLCLTLFDF